MRVWEHAVFEDVDGVVAMIGSVILQPATGHPPEWRVVRVGLDEQQPAVVVLDILATVAKYPWHTDEEPTVTFRIDPADREASDRGAAESL